MKNPTANAGDMGSIPGPGRSHVLQRNSPGTPTTEAVFRNPGTAATEVQVP